MVEPEETNVDENTVEEDAGHEGEEVKETPKAEDDEEVMT